MALISLCCYDTVENGRSEYTERVLESLLDYIRFYDHRLIIVDNASCEATKKILDGIKESRKDLSSILDAMDEYRPDMLEKIQIITNPENVGTAKAINQAWKHRRPNEHLIKMDNDCLVNYEGDWASEMEAAIERDPTIGIIGLKRKDCAEDPNNEFGRWDYSFLKGLPHTPGQPWINVEVVNHVIGTCQMYNHRLIDKIGGLYQMDGIYGFDDSLAAVRCHLAGFYNCFLPHIDIDHIDRGDNPYQKEKEAYAMSMMDKFNQTKAAMIAGKMDINFPL